MDAAFPLMEVEAEGYNAAMHGQKGFNGVAILAKTPIEATGLPGGLRRRTRPLHRGSRPKRHGVVRVASIYLPNGDPPKTEKFGCKLAFMDRLIAHARTLLALEEPLVLAGDYNVIPRPAMAPTLPPGTATRYFCLETRRVSPPAQPWPHPCAAHDERRTRAHVRDYQAGAWQRNKGIHDHLSLSPRAADLLAQETITKARRGEDKPSDHVPVEIAWRDGRS